MSTAFDLGAKAWEDERYEEAFRCFRDGVAAGDRSCLLNLGYCHDTGLGTRIDKAAAMACYLRDVKADGGGGAANNIAILYREQGRHVAEFYWFRQAALRQDGGANVELAKLYLSGRGVRRSVGAARHCLTLALRSTYISEGEVEEAEELQRNLPSRRPDSDRD